MEILHFRTFMMIDFRGKDGKKIIVILAIQTKCLTAIFSGKVNLVSKTW